MLLCVGQCWASPPAVVAVAAPAPVAPAPAQAEMRIADARVIEGNSGSRTLAFSVTLAAPSTATVTATFATANGNAMAGTDFVAVSGSLSFAPGETARTVSVTVNGDTVPEPTESFTMNLSSPTNATLDDASSRRHHCQ